MTQHFQISIMLFLEVEAVEHTTTPEVDLLLHVILLPGPILQLPLWWGLQCSWHLCQKWDTNLESSIQCPLKSGSNIQVVTTQENSSTQLLQRVSFSYLNEKSRFRNGPAPSAAGFPAVLLLQLTTNASLKSNPF